VSTNDASTNHWPLSIGDPFPDVELIDHSGETWRPSPGRPLVLILHRHLA
jgi:hypothetical protein